MAVFRRYLTEAEEKRFFATVDRPRDIWARRDCAVFRLLRTTGARVGSACGLTVGDAKTALREPYHLHFVSSAAKGGRGYSIFATQATRRHLRALLAIRRELGLAETADAPLLVSRQTASTGRGMTRRAVQQRFEYWRAEAGMADVSPHWMRHTLAQRVMRNSTARDPRGVVQGMLGQSSINSTAIYTKPSKEDLQAAFEEVA